MNEDLKEKVLTDIKNWWDSSQKYGTKRPFWRIFHSSTKASKGKKAQENTEIADVDSSFDFFLDSLSGMMEYLDRYITLTLATSKTDAAPVQWVIENPMYVHNSSNGVTNIQGIGNSHAPVISTGYSKQDVDKMVTEQISIYKQLHQQQMDSLRKEMEYKKDIEDLQNQIQGIAEGQKSMFDKVMGIAEHPVVANAISILITKFLGVDSSQIPNNNVKTNPQNNINNNGKVSGDTYEEEYDEDNYDDDKTDLQDNQTIIANKIHRGLEGLEKAFPNESIEVLQELGVLAKKNPEILKQLRGTMQNLINEK